MVETLTDKWQSQKQCMAGKQLEWVIALHCSRPEVDLWVVGSKWDSSSFEVAGIN